jgi:glycosyltransferase involved in cell wall biosynthesis
MATTDIPTVGIILTHNRPELLARVVAAAGPQFDHLVVVDNASDPPINHEALRDFYGKGAPLVVLPIPDQPPNISRMWTQALGYARVNVKAFYLSSPAERWNVVLLCDDITLPDGWVSLVASGMREHGAAAACTHPIRSIAQSIVKTAPDSDIMNRMTGWAFMLAGELGLEPSLGLEWWWVDTDLDWQARTRGGMVILPGPVVVNERPNDFTVNRPELGQRAGEDGKAFAEIWGWRPW